MRRLYSTENTVHTVQSIQYSKEYTVQYSTVPKERERVYAVCTVQYI